MAGGYELHEACTTGDHDLLEDLLRTGKYDVDLKDPDFCDKTPLHWACHKGYVDCLRLLLDKGATGDARMSTGWTPAHCAAEAGKLTALRALHIAGIPVHKRDNYGDRPSRVAEIYGHQDCLKYLQQIETERAEKKMASENISNASLASDSDDSD